MTLARPDTQPLAAAIAKEQTWYSDDADRYLSYYADDAISVQPGVPEIDGKAAFAEATAPYMADYQVTGKLTMKRIWVYGDLATRQAEWEEVAVPKAGGPAEHHIGAAHSTGRRLTANGRSSPSTSTTSILRLRYSRSLHVTCIVDRYGSRLFVGSRISGQISVAPRRQ